MRIQVRRSGGFAGTTREAAVDSTDRPDAERWRALALRALAVGRAAPPPGVPDGFRYALTVGDRTVYFADPEVPEPAAELVSLLFGASP
ncbi:metalloprotease [Wenjunlia vitaminophila]|uniref:Metalloprotease n=1 Tax=Wenjunlia vitaminophila TaxID=76728 RepID=A0A0T6LKM9_WENVI|nr:protealysin inhibitor emfourin [Wenjunlia vitaminophila]KRV46433.1 metalloprotease [Wenjunlia vitaminophila]